MQCGACQTWVRQTEGGDRIDIRRQGELFARCGSHAREQGEPCYPTYGSRGGGAGRTRPEAGQAMPFPYGSGGGGAGRTRTGAGRAMLSHVRKQRRRSGADTHGSRGSHAIPRMEAEEAERGGHARELGEPCFPTYGSGGGGAGRTRTGAGRAMPSHVWKWKRRRRSWAGRKAECGAVRHPEQPYI
jgi:hypothetical protein